MSFSEPTLSEPRYKYEVEIKFRPVYSPDSFGKPSLLLTTQTGSNVNVTLAEKDEWMEQGKKNVYLVNTTVKIESIKNVSFGWTSEKMVDTLSHVSINLKLKPLFHSGIKERNFSGHFIRANIPSTLFESKKSLNSKYLNFDTNVQKYYHYKVNVSFEPVYSPNSFGKMSLKFVPEDEKNSFNVSLSAFDEELNQMSHKVYDVFVPLRMDEIKFLNFSWTTPVERREFDSRHIVATFEFSWNNLKPRKFYSSLAFPFQVSQLWEEKEENTVSSSENTVLGSENTVSISTYKNEVDGNHFLFPVWHDYIVNVTFQVVYSSNSFGRMSLKFVPEDNSNSVNVSLSKVDEELNQMTTKSYNVSVPLQLEQIKTINFTYTTPIPREEFDTRHLIARIQVFPVPAGGRSRKFYSSLAFPNEVYQLWEDRKEDKVETYKYEVEIKFNPVYSPDVFGKPSLLLTTQTGSEVNVTLTEEEQWMKQGRKNVYVVETSVKVEDVRNVTFGWTTPQPVEPFDYRHVSITLNLKPLDDKEARERKFAGHLIKANTPRTLWEQNVTDYNLIDTEILREKSHTRSTQSGF